MKRIIILLISTIISGSCGNRNQQNNEVENGTETIETVYSVDALLNDADALVDQKVVVKGTVMHVCKQGGGRCFLMGSNEDFNIRIEAGEEIGAFDQNQMGADLTVTGILKMVRTEADAHNPASEHGASDAAHDKATEDVHRMIMESKVDAAAVYFIEGIRILQVEV